MPASAAVGLADAEAQQQREEDGERKVLQATTTAILCAGVARGRGRAAGTAFRVSRSTSTTTYTPPAQITRSTPSIHALLACCPLFPATCTEQNVFTKITILDDFLISGSVAASAPIWFISDADRIDPCYRMHVKPRYVLPHDDEVTVVDVHRLSMNIFALSDDVKINKWNLFQKLDQKIDPASGQTHLKAVKYEEKDVDIEEMLPRIREMGGRSDRQPNTPSTPTIAASSASASVITTPKSGQSRGTPLTTLKDWLTVTNSNSPSESLIQQSSSSKKRPHIVAKENSQAKKLKTGGKISSKSRPV